LPKPIQHSRITRLPIPEPICAGHLDTFFTETHGRRMDFVLEYHALVPDSVELFERDGKLSERSRGVYLPRRLRFRGIERLKISGPYQNLAVLLPDHPARIIVDMYNYQGKNERLYYYLLYGRSQEDAEFQFNARGVTREERDGDPIPFTHERDWSPAPPMPARLAPEPHSLWQRFGGDPVTVYLDGKSFARRLFVGGVDIQPEQRPQVDAVLNLGEEPSRWTKTVPSPACDRWENHGEGSRGMGVDDLRAEAEWVIERLRAGQRVLVHCAAGMNRSITICCAVLVLLEGLTAEAALERVRAQHPWARPDGHHWLALKWLVAGESNNQK
jgi:hypothetical protein